MPLKKIISILIKLLIGVVSFMIVYLRLREDLTADNLTIINTALFSGSGLLFLVFVVLLVPLNWGIESYKWKKITEQIENISFNRAQRSVYSGVCLGNLAPGRATEFIAKVFFFQNINRPAITILHFINGMFQLSMTYFFGILALILKIQSFGEAYQWLVYTVFSIVLLVVSVFVYSIRHTEKLLHFFMRRFKKNEELPSLNFQFNASLMTLLFGFSILRYIVFFLQMLLLFAIFSVPLSADLIIGIILYFLITTTIPMISMIEAAIRAAIALIVFKDCGIPNTVLALTSVLLWLINIILPSAAGYYFLLQEKFDFSSGKKTT